MADFGPNLAKENKRECVLSNLTTFYSVLTYYFYSFSYCELTPVCGEHIANMLKKNETLKEL